MEDVKTFWDDTYADGDIGRSWTEARPLTSLNAIEAVSPGRRGAIIDIGGGSSRLSGELLAAGYVDVTVLDISGAALRLAQSRLGPDADRINWIAEDLLAWKPTVGYDIWHDRAVMHFFTKEKDRRRYAALTAEAVKPGGHAIIATFALDGPQRCSGLPVRRSSPADLEELFADDFTMVSAADDLHRSPSGIEQRFIRVTLRRLVL